ncbi:hypothetical protein GLOIN_2v1786147 [Rhizophagus irregularis DAOM 181602=DAOM 197198]|nr:hypothetical protein GLOIN_2v1786147 [Rhizophagus irregularis DAOM 181602=DAOM 197198]
MTRKRSLSSILNEESDSRPHAIPSSRIQRTRSVSNIIDEESSNQSYPTSSRIGRLVAYSEDDDSERTEVHLPDEAELPTDEPYKSASISDEPRMRESEAELPRDTVDDKSSESSEYTTEEDANIDDRNESSDNEPSNDDEYHEIFEDYSCPPFEPFQDSDTEQSINNRFLWILLWIMSFRTRFNLPETATESLIKFLKLVLTEIGSPDFDTFPDTLYLARKALNLEDRFHSFVACSKCHKLYNKQEIKSFLQNEQPAIMKCCHVEFPNSTTRRLRLCQTPLAQKTTLLNNQISIKPELLFPFVSIKQQLEAMYRQPNFENSLRHWINRPTFDNILTDIYDGEVWKTFKETTDESSNNFFRSDVADSHLGLILNLDWFQPFDGTIHSTGVIYAAIGNLPRDVRFKRNNILILGLLPGPDEVSLHKINHYLAPIIDELKSLWEGVTLNKTYECQEGKRIRAALILVSCDIPAARKICGHISALVSCHRCEKKANYENRQHNFAGINEMDEWFTCRDSAQHRQDAIGWRRCNSDAARKRFVKQTGVRWSELLRLPYFDPIRFITIDPIHCLFLGIAKWIVRRLWIENGVLTTHILKTVQKKMDEFKVPADLGRIPGKVNCGDGFSNFTADQWQIFFTIYATVSLWEHLSENDRKILVNFVRICSISVSRIVEVDFMREAHQRLINLVKLIEENYGRDKITPNLHLSLHLCECSLDYGPLYTFWCFSFERMNGMLGSFPNSRRKIEPEIMRRLMFDNQISNIINFGVESKGLDLISNRPSVGSLSEADQFSADEMRRFWLTSRNIHESTTTGKEAFPGEMLRPVFNDIVMSSDMLDLIVEYYMASYEMMEFRKPFGEGAEDSIIVQVKMNQFGRCRIGSEIFGSSISSRHVKSSFILAKFMTESGDIDCYPGQVQYFFTHAVNLPDGLSEHNLAFIRWYKPAESSNIRYHFRVRDDEICNVELWGTEFYPESRDCIIPVHHILGRFIPTKYRISGRRSSNVYLAVNPVNRKFHIR